MGASSTTIDAIVRDLEAFGHSHRPFKTTAGRTRSAGGGERVLRAGTERAAAFCWTAPGSGAAPAFRTRRRRERRQRSGAGRREPRPRSGAPRAGRSQRGSSRASSARGSPGGAEGRGQPSPTGGGIPAGAGPSGPSAAPPRLTPRPLPPQVTPCLLFWSAQPIGRGGWILREPGWARRGGSGTLPYRP